MRQALPRAPDRRMPDARDRRAGIGQDERIVINPPDSISDGEQVRVTQAAGGSPQKSAEEIAQTGREHEE